MWTKNEVLFTLNFSIRLKLASLDKKWNAVYLEGQKTQQWRTMITSRSTRKCAFILALIAFITVNATEDMRLLSPSTLLISVVCCSVESSYITYTYQIGHDLVNNGWHNMVWMKSRTRIHFLLATFIKGYFLGWNAGKYGLDHIIGKHLRSANIIENAFPPLV